MIAVSTRAGAKSFRHPHRIGAFARTAAQHAGFETGPNDAYLGARKRRIPWPEDGPATMR